MNLNNTKISIYYVFPTLEAYICFSVGDIQFYITYSESSLEKDSEHILKYLETNKFNKKLVYLK